LPSVALARESLLT